MRKNFIISKLIVCFLVISLMFSLQAMMNSDSTDAPLYVPTFSSAASDSSANMPGKFDFSSADDQAVQVVEVGTQVDTIGEDESWSECDEEPCVLQNEEAEGLVDRKSVGVQAGKGGLSEIPPVDCKYDCDREFQLLLDLILACKGLGAKDVFGNEKIKSDIFNILSRAFNNYALPDMLGLGVGFPEQGTVVVEFFSFLSFAQYFGSAVIQVILEAISKILSEADQTELSSILNFHDQAGWTLLHYASFCGFTDIVRHLLDLGANPHAKRLSEYTPLALAEVFLKEKAFGNVILLLNEAEKKQVDTVDHSGVLAQNSSREKEGNGSGCSTPRFSGSATINSFNSQSTHAIPRFQVNTGANYQSRVQDHDSSRAISRVLISSGLPVGFRRRYLNSRVTNLSKSRSYEQRKAFLTNKTNLKNSKKSNINNNAKEQGVITKNNAYLLAALVAAGVLTYTTVVESGRKLRRKVMNKISSVFKKRKAKALDCEETLVS